MAYTYERADVINGSLNMRLSTSTSSERLAIIPNGTALKVTTCDNPSWFKTNYGGQDGYIMAQYVFVFGSGLHANVCGGRLRLRSTPSSTNNDNFIDWLEDGADVFLLDERTNGFRRVTTTTKGTGWAAEGYFAFG